MFVVISLFVVFASESKDKLQLSSANSLLQVPIIS